MENNQIKDNNEANPSERVSINSPLWVGSLLLYVSLIGIFAIFTFDRLSSTSFSTGPTIDENNVIALKDISSLNSGKSIFEVRCSPCHGFNGGGTVGPNLTDDYWIHGCGVKDIFKTVKYGVPAKGMIAWDGILTPQEIQQAVSYLISLRGSNPPNAKPPEGALCLPNERENLKNDTVKISSDTAQFKINKK